MAPARYSMQHNLTIPESRPTEKIWAHRDSEGCMRDVNDVDLGKGVWPAVDIKSVPLAPASLRNWFFSSGLLLRLSISMN